MKNHPETYYSVVYEGKDRASGFDGVPTMAIEKYYDSIHKGTM